jgi:hypothetical protein
MLRTLCALEHVGIVDGGGDLVAPVALEAERGVDALREGLGGTSSSQAVAVSRGPLALPSLMLPPRIPLLLPPLDPLQLEMK